MPELPEVEIVRLGLKKSLAGKKIQKVDIFRRESIEFPKANAFATQIVGKTFCKFKRKGKYLILEFDDRSNLIVHLRMSGKLLIQPQDCIADRHLRVRFLLTDALELHFIDMRVFGRLWYCSKDRDPLQSSKGLSMLGPDALNQLKENAFYRILEAHPSKIKGLLLDQSKVAGIGNIYADEALHLAGIHPAKKANTLSKKASGKLFETIQQVLKNSIRLGGSSLKDYQNAFGVNGNYQNNTYVYGRAGKPCLHCNTLIEKTKLAGRTTSFCPDCQKN